MTTPPGVTIYAPIALGDTLPARTGIYIPERFRATPDLDVIVYLHGHLIAGCGNTATDQVDRYWTRPRFLLREGLDQTGRSFLLIVPSLGSQSQSGLLRKAGGFDIYMKQVLAALVEHAGPGPTRPRDITRIILAAHSGGGSTMRAIATGTGTYARRIRECWGFDSLYGGDDPETWARWAGTHRDSRLYVHYTLRGGTKGHSLRLRDKALANVIIPDAPPSDEHCDVPKIYWQRRIQAALRPANAARAA